MTITIKDLGDLVIYAGAIAVALTAIGVVARVVVVRPLLRWLRKELQPAVQETRQVATETRDAATKVQAEVSPNGGSSIKDAITRMDAEMQVLSTRLTDHITNHPRS
ncbi:hypothetical protein [Thermomonospora cellulosilytica]|uniref:Na+/glutamate symporter n=1 Tax=Thermomonospora cellulosilytica TaxID=1411118 RepID=A0A7W3MU72_9ACTN|nr:hypothetical protein [Thermomonospora cellulosilytica]MBA9002001.1 Na+/glutamate symporter [Thermomonospora cellulosilytica]